MASTARSRLAALTLSGFVALGIVAAAGPATANESPESTVSAGKGHDGPVIVGHRGASGYRPEHTLAAYELAYRQGVDWVDVDLVPTKDGELVARHENEIGGTTDVAEHAEFADRKTTKTIDGAEVTGWFTEDFTLAELKTLRATERIPENRPNNTIYDGRYEIPTFQEVLDQTRRLSRELHRDLGTYPEIKHSTYFAGIDNPTEPKLVEILRHNRLTKAKSPVVIQSFEVANLKALNEKIDVRLVQLTSATGAPADFVAGGDPRTYADLVTPEGLAEVATYADYLGPAKEQIIPLDDEDNLAEPTSLVADSHRAGLLVAPYTFRNENPFLPANLRSDDPADPTAWGDIFAEYEAFLATGIDGFFADQPDTAVEATRG